MPNDQPSPSQDDLAEFAATLTDMSAWEAYSVHPAGISGKGTLIGTEDARLLVRDPSVSVLLGHAHLLAVSLSDVLDTALDDCPVEYRDLDGMSACADALDLLPDGFPMERLPRPPWSLEIAPEDIRGGPASITAGGEVLAETTAVREVRGSVDPLPDALATMAVAPELVAAVHAVADGADAWHPAVVAAVRRFLAVRDAARRLAA